MSNSTQNDTLNNGWRIIKFGDCIKQLNTGLNPRTNFSLGDGNIKYITAKNLTKYGTIDFSKCDYIDEDAKRIINRRSDIKIGDILFSSRAPIGHCHLIKEEPDYYDIGESIFSIRVNKDVVLPEYMCLYLASDYFVKSASKHTTGSIILEIRINDLMNTQIIVPPQEVQASIAKCLRKIDRKIELNEKINDNLQQQLKTIYDYWFVQFDFPDVNGNPYCSSGGQMVWNADLKGYIPAKWNKTNIREIANVTWGQCPDGKNILDRSASGIGILDYCSGAGDMKGGFVVDCQAKTDNSKRIARKNDILVSVAGKIGDVCVVDHTISLGRAAAAFTAKSVHELPYIYLTLQALNKKMLTISSGSIQKVINNDHVNDFCFPYSHEIVQQFGDITLKMFYELIRLEHESRNLISLRDWLLPMLMNGQAAISD